MRDPKNPCDPRNQDPDVETALAALLGSATTFTEARVVCDEIARLRAEVARLAMLPAVGRSGSVALHVSYAPTEQQRDELRRALNALHGYPDGVPLDAPSPPELVEAHHRISGARVELELVIRIDADGSLAVESVSRRDVQHRDLAPPPEPSFWSNVGHARPLTREDIARAIEATRERAGKPE